MKKAAWLAVALAALLLGLGAARAEGRVYLRVVARDDSPAAQAEKLRVRDRVLSVCPDRMDSPGALLALARDAACSLAPCQVDWRWWSPGEGTPAAPTVHIVIGPGRGRNWWGVLYRDALGWARAGEENGGGETVFFLWPVWDWLCRLLGGG